MSKLDRRSFCRALALGSAALGMPLPAAWSARSFPTTPEKTATICSPRCWARIPGRVATLSCTTRIWACSPSARASGNSNWASVPVVSARRREWSRLPVGRPASYTTSPRTPGSTRPVPEIPARAVQSPRKIQEPGLQPPHVSARLRGGDCYSIATSRRALFPYRSARACRIPRGIQLSTFTDNS